MGGNTNSSRPVTRTQVGIEARQAPSADTLENLELAYREHLDSVLRTCRRYLGDHMDAEDAAQGDLHSFRAPAHAADRRPRPYLTVVARNVCRDELKKRAQRSSVVPETPADESIENRYMSIALTRSVWNRLNGRDRQLFAHIFAGYRYHELAERTGMSPKAVSVGLTRARQRARKALGTGSAAMFAPVMNVRRWFAERRRAFNPSTTNLSVFQDVALRTAIAGVVVVGGALGGLPGPTAGSPDHVVNARPADVAIGSARTNPVSGQLTAADLAAASPAGNIGGSAQLSLVHGFVTPNQGAQDGDAQFSSFTRSPNYADDHTVYASGSLVTGCSRPAGCPVVFRTTDGGVSWGALASLGFGGGQVLLPPNPAQDPTIFSIGRLGLQQSVDSGATFLTVAPSATAAAIAPDSGPGHARVLLGGAAMLIYDAGTHVVTAGPVLPPGVQGPSQVAFLGPSQVVAVAVRPDEPRSEAQPGVVVTCPIQGACRTTFAEPASAQLQLALSPSASTHQTVVAYSTRRVYVSRDAGQSFALVPATFGGDLVSLEPASDYSTSHRLIGAALSVSGEALPLTSVQDDGTGQRILGRAGLPAGSTPFSALSLPDGRLLLALSRSGVSLGRDFGVRCSLDAGASWRKSC